MSRAIEKAQDFTADFANSQAQMFWRTVGLIL
jgi:hypothetical protein